MNRLLLGAVAFPAWLLGAALALVGVAFLIVIGPIGWIILVIGVMSEERERRHEELLAAIRGRASHNTEPGAMSLFLGGVLWLLLAATLLSR